LSRLTFIVRDPRYFAAGDEKAFFTWLESIPCVADVKGHLRDLHITLKRQPGSADLRELIALLSRYRMNMRGLAVYRTARNAHWFADPQTFWHAKVFAKQKRAKGQ
jgi:hypothetical protein